MLLLLKVLIILYMRSPLWLCKNQCSGSKTLWCGSGFRSLDLYTCFTEPDPALHPYPDPDPALFRQ
jgi:hypothetical protein